MKRLLQVLAAVSFGLVLGILSAKLRLLVGGDSFSALAAKTMAFDLDAEVLQVLPGFGALALSAFALIGLGCVPKTRHSSQEAADSDQLIARDLQEAQKEQREANAEEQDALPRKVNGTASRPDLQPVADFVRDYLSIHLDELEPGLTKFFDTNGDCGIRYATPLGEIDVLAKDREQNLVVVKIALNDKPDALCGRLLGQIAWVRQHLAAERKVRGILVAHKIPNELRYALSEIPSVRTCEYELQVNLRGQDSPQVTPSVTMPHDVLAPASVCLVS
ncbi:MAG: hypothetical protein H8E44_18490 [Planctomycetes bacterium]|nr:hypothetical protein [Planctomycetota bacterium]MBL7041887.1 hypothetical protein [Pirellulaceae bacterium]